MKTTLSLSTLALLISLTIPAGLSLASAAPTPPLPTDLQLVPSDALPGRGTTWWSVSRWGKFPPSPVNWCAGRTDVLYYRSASFGTNKIVIDDSLVDYSQTAQASAVLSSLTQSAGSPGPLSPNYGSNDLWLEIHLDTNTANQVDVILHGTTNGVWQLLTKTNLSDTNLAWTVLEIQIDDGTTNALYFGPYPDDNPPASFFRAQLATNLFIVVATNLPSPVGIDYHPQRQSLILPINYNNNAPAFGILDTNAFLTNWSDLNFINEGFEVRIATVKITTNGFNAGDLLYSSGVPGLTPATIGWLSADGTTAVTNWVTITNDANQIEALYIDQTGRWGNDLLAVTGADAALSQANLNVWRVHSPTNVQLVTSIPTQHLEGLLTLPNDPRYGPWAGTLLTADETEGTVYAVSTNGTFTTNTLGFNADTIRLIPTNQDLYCVQFRTFGRPCSILKVPKQFFRRYVGDILLLQAGVEVPSDHPKLLIVHWNGNSFEVHEIDLFTYFPFDGFFEKVAFAPIDLPPIPQ